MMFMVDAALRLSPDRLIVGGGTDVRIKRVTAIVEWLRAITDRMTGSAAVQTVTEPIMGKLGTFMLVNITPDGGGDVGMKDEVRNTASDWRPHALLPRWIHWPVNGRNLTQRDRKRATPIPRNDRCLEVVVSFARIREASNSCGLGVLEAQDPEWVAEWILRKALPLCDWEENIYLVFENGYKVGWR